MPFTTAPLNYVAQSDHICELLETVTARNGPTLVRQALETYVTEGWRDFDDKDVISIIKNIIVESVSMANGLKAFIACLNTIYEIQLDDDERYCEVVIHALESVLPICDAVWFELELCFSSGDKTPKLLFLSFAFLHSILQFKADERYRGLFECLISSSSIVYIAMHGFLYAPTTSEQQEANVNRLQLISCGPSNGSLHAIYTYFDKFRPEDLSIVLKSIIKTSSFDNGSLVECLSFLMYLKGMYGEQVEISLDLWTDLIHLLQRIVECGSIGYDILVSSIHHGNLLFEYFPEDSLELFNVFFCHNEGSKLLADLAVMVATNWRPEISAQKRRPTLFFSFPRETCMELSSSIFKRPLLFLVYALLVHLERADSLRERSAMSSILCLRFKPIWHDTLIRLRVLEPHEHPGASAITKVWCRLGGLVGTHILVTPLVGCTWVNCPYFVQNTTRTMAICSKCKLVQYCDARCQKYDWNSHKKTCYTMSKSKIA